MVNFKSSRSEIKLFWKFTKKQLRNFQEQPFKKLLWTVSPIILAALWTTCILWTISFFLWIITVTNFNYTWENLGTMDEFNFSNFQFMLLLQSGFKPRKKVLLINFISTYHNWLKNFTFSHFLLIKGYRKYSIRKESVISPFVEWLKAPRESSSWILLALRAICSKAFLWVDNTLIFCQLQKMKNVKNDLK